MCQEWQDPVPPLLQTYGLPRGGPEHVKHEHELKAEHPDTRGLQEAEELQPKHLLGSEAERGKQTNVANEELWLQ